MLAYIGTHIFVFGIWIQSTECPYGLNMNIRQSAIVLNTQRMQLAYPLLSQVYLVPV